MPVVSRGTGLRPVVSAVSHINEPAQRDPGRSRVALVPGGTPVRTRNLRVLQPRQSTSTPRFRGGHVHDGLHFAPCKAAQVRNGDAFTALPLPSTSTMASLPHFASGAIGCSRYSCSITQSTQGSGS